MQFAWKLSEARREERQDPFTHAPELGLLAFNIDLLSRRYLVYGLRYLRRPPFPACGGSGAVAGSSSSGEIELLAPI